MTTTENVQPEIAGPPSRHQLGLMIWLCVFPTLTVINLLLGSWLGTLSPVARTFVLATIAVPIVIYGVMPHLHRLRIRPPDERSGELGVVPRDVVDGRLRP